MKRVKLVEQAETAPRRRGMPVPVQEAYRLAELLPRRPEAPRSEGPGPGATTMTYKLPFEMGRELGRAFERAFDLLDRAYGGLEVRAPSKLLSPRWHRVFARLVHHGLAETLTLSLPLEEGIPLYYFDIGSPFLSQSTDGVQPELPRYSRGFSEDYDHALAKVVGECLERGPLLYYRMADMVRGSAKAMRSAGKRILEPSVLSVFSPEQRRLRPETRFDDDSIFHWTRSTSLLTSEEAWVPAQTVYWNYPMAWGDVPEPMLRECSTHGAGGFYSLEGALLSGALECVQRDGFFLHWLRRVAPRRIDLATISRPNTLKVIREAQEVGLEVLFFDISTELGIPVCLCILRRGDDVMPHITMGGSCRLDGETAIHDAFLEAASVHHVLARETAKVSVGDDYAPLTDASFGAHKRLAYWGNPEHGKEMDFFLQGGTTTVSEFCRGVPIGAVRENLAWVIEAFKRHKVEAWYVEARHAALDELGYASVRVLTPRLVPLYYEERNIPLALPRLYEPLPFAPGAGRIEAIAPTRAPHPFP